MKFSTTTTIAVLLLVSGATAQAQQLTVGEALATKQRAASGEFSAQSEWTALGYYFRGVIEGAAGYQETLISSGKPTAFCPPQNKSYSVDEIFRFLERSSKSDKSRPASVVILEAYSDAFPCRG